MKIIAGLASAALLAAVSTAGAEVPNLVGTWKPVELASARYGTFNPQHEMPTDLVLSNDPRSGVAFVIDKQDGAAFSGRTVGPGGKAGTLVGAIRRDGRNFAVSTDFGAGTGIIEGDELEFCWFDTNPYFAAVSCYVHKRE